MADLEYELRLLGRQRRRENPPSVDVADRVLQTLQELPTLRRASARAMAACAALFALAASLIVGVALLGGQARTTPENAATVLWETYAPSVDGLLSGLRS